MTHIEDVRNYYIGEIYLIRFEGSGSEQSGLRPGLIFQNNLGNKFSPNIIALPITSKIKRTNQPTHVILPKEIGLKETSMVLCENPEGVSKERIGKYITKLPDKYMEQVAISSILSSSAISFITYNSLFDLWQKANSLNKGVA